ncbi:type IV secretion system DNA-binding domain-containing protein [Candidatus Peregrinibacteria bacterium]|nr:type IV secretion system DNA-binding domain-containing protein [Candidatus Peregrinibacteria bacterium]
MFEKIILNLAIYSIAASILTLAYFFVKARIINYFHLKKSLNLVFLKVQVAKKESKEEQDQDQSSGPKDFKEAIGIGAQLLDSLHSIHSGKWQNKYVGEDFISMEYVVIQDQIFFYLVVPSELSSLIEKQITGFYPDAYIEQVEEYNIFKPDSKTAATSLTLQKPFLYPIKSYQRLISDPINNLTNALSKLEFEDGAVVQIMIRPAVDWQKEGREHAKNMLNQKPEKKGFDFNPIKILAAILDFMMARESKSDSTPEAPGRTTPMTDEEIKDLESKNTGKGYETIIRIVCAGKDEREAKSNLTNIVSTFAQYASQNANSFSSVKKYKEREIIEDYILRKFDWPVWSKFRKKIPILSSEEIASIYHLPNIRFNKTPGIHWQNYKIAPVPKNIPKEGLLLGHNHYRGVTSDIRMKREDRFRHFYVIGQTGTGKSSIFQVMARQDLRNGDGIAMVDPHGSLIEDILPFIPRQRADDVIYFNPADQARPMGLNLLEADSDDEKELVALDAMNIMIKLFGNEIFGPRIQDYFRNGCLTLMAHPEGGTMVDIVRLFTDDDFQKERVNYVKNPVVKSFWTDQMAKTGAREKQEIIPYFAAKFGQFITNSMMRNIIGQPKSAFDFIDVMQNKKILLMNLSKGEVGDINSKLLGLIIVSKLQMAALRRQRFAKEDRSDFFMYIDEFQNYITDSIESILSEARKYRLSLNMAHQYIAQLEGEDGKSKVKDAVFGNVGTMMCYKIGATDAEYMAKEMAPVFTAQDLINVDNFKGVMKLAIDGQPSVPFSISVPLPWLEQGDKKVGEAIKQLSRLKYGRDRDFVEREITRRIGIID